MGCHGSWAENSSNLPNGLLPGTETCVGRVLDEERWSKAEDSIAELIARIQPDEAAGERRKAIADFIQGLIGKCFSCQVFIFGSVPLKTYLPDGDIDLTVFSTDENLETWANKVYQVIEEEVKNENAEFYVTEVQLIEAEVKIIKCLVEDIVVDISCNQIGGLGTLCFLNEIDNLINQDHLFKRSVILIKAWCYYESRILGAHRGLISTYALETLILYIFHVFDNSLSGPLEVLYRFLDFFSNFDWDNFCVSIWGPIPMHLLPNMAVMPPRKKNGEFFQNKLFLKICSVVYDSLPSGQHNQSRSFISKHLNIVDPLCTQNNLGRSISKGNFLRICSAFAFGAKSLAKLLECPKEKMLSELTQFFMNTWKGHGASIHTNASILGMGHSQPSNAIQVGASYTSKNISCFKEGNFSADPNCEHLADVCLSFYGTSSQILRIINQHSKDINRYNGIRKVVSHTQDQEDYSSEVLSKNQDQLGKIFFSAESEANKSHENLMSTYNNNIEGGEYSVQDELGMFDHSVRTCFLSGLIKTSDISSGGSHSLVHRIDTYDALPGGLAHDCRIKSLASGVMSYHTEISIGDPSYSRRSLSPQDTVSNGASHSYHDNAVFSTVAASLSGESESERQFQNSYNQYPAVESYRALWETCNYEVPTNETAQMRDSDTMVSTVQVLPTNSQQRESENSGVFPSVLYPTGPPVPFLAMLQTYSFRSHRSCYGGSFGMFSDDLLNCDSTVYYQKVDSDGNFDHQENHVTVSAIGNRLPEAPALPNLHYGWPIQNIPCPRPSFYPNPVAVPIMYFQGCFPLSGSARSILSHGPATCILPETQMGATNFLPFGGGGTEHHGGIRTYPPSP